MSSFALNRRALLGLMAASLLMGHTMTPQAAHADTSWAELLKPLVKDVIVPGAKMGVQKWAAARKAAEDKKNGVSSEPDVITVSPESTDGGTIIISSGEDVTIPTPDGAENEVIQISPAASDAPPPPPALP